MDIGVPKEIKDNEFRVALVPDGVKVLVEAGHRVYVQSGAGLGSSITDVEYSGAGAVIKDSARDVYGNAHLIVKVKEPLYKEFSLLHDGLMVFTFLHLAANHAVAGALMRAGAVGLAYETLETDAGVRPLLDPMSEIAGKLSVQVGARYLEKTEGGAGVLLGGAEGTEKGRTLILGLGMVGRNAARVALALGAEVTVISRNMEKMQDFNESIGGGLQCLASTPANIEKSLAGSDLLVGAVHSTGARTPTLVSADMVASMKKGSVIVDVSVDQGGCVETMHATTHSSPVFEVDGVLHYGVANMPGSVPRTATFALSSASLPYIQKIAEKGLKTAAREDSAIRRAVNVFGGRLSNKGAAEAIGKEYFPYEP